MTRAITLPEGGGRAGVKAGLLINATRRGDRGASGGAAAVRHDGCGAERVVRRLRAVVIGSPSSGARLRALFLSFCSRVFPGCFFESFCEKRRAKGLGFRAFQ